MTYKKEENTVKNEKSEFLFGVLLVYFVICLLIGAIGHEKHFLTYGQLSLLYAPLLAVFIVWQIGRYRKQQDKTQLPLSRVVASVGICSVILLLTIIYNLGAFAGLL